MFKVATDLGAIAWGVLLAALLTTSHVILKLSSQSPTGSIAWLIRVGMALAIYFFVFLLYSFLLKSISISKLYPVYTGLSVLLVFASGAVLFDETVSSAQIAGLLLVIAGVFLLTRN